MTKLKDIPKVDRPREKLVEKGPQSLRNNELLAILLGSGMQGKNVIAVADSILAMYPHKRLLTATLQELKNIPGIGTTKAIQLLAALELGRRLLKEKASGEVCIKTPEDVVREVAHIREHKKEHFVALYLDVQSRLLHKETISIGTLTASLVHPREVFAPGLHHAATHIVVVHNHPSGNPEPSREDFKLTGQLTDAGQILGIDLVDHVIVSTSDYCSMKALDLL